MRAELTQLPPLQHQDPVCHADGGKPVRDEDRGLAPCELRKALEHPVLRPISANLTKRRFHISRKNGKFWINNEAKSTLC